MVLCMETSWYEMKEQRRINRRNANFAEGHARRGRGFFVLLEKTSGEVVVQARNGCFGRLKELKATRDLYEEWAAGTRGSETSGFVES